MKRKKERGKGARVLIEEASGPSGGSCELLAALEGCGIPSLAVPWLSLVDRGSSRVARGNGAMARNGPWVTRFVSEPIGLVPLQIRLFADKPSSLTGSSTFVLKRGGVPVIVQASGMECLGLLDQTSTSSSKYIYLSLTSHIQGRIAAASIINVRYSHGALHKRAFSGNSKIGTDARYCSINLW